MRAEFDAVLTDYQPSEHARRVIRDSTFVVLTGPSGAGRNTIIRELDKTDRYHFVISTTTRPPRYNNGVLEQNGREYWFIDERKMLDLLKEGEFLEAEVIHGQQVSGTSVAELEIASREHKIAIADVDIAGIANILHAKTDSIAALVFPPDFESWQKRLLGRGGMDAQQLKRRLETAVRIFALAEDERYRIVINDTVEHASQQVRAMAEQGVRDPIPRNEAREIARRLREDTLVRLAKMSD